MSKTVYLVRSIIKWSDMDLDVPNSIGFSPLFTNKKHALKAARGNKALIDVLTVKDDKA